MSKFKSLTSKRSKNIIWFSTISYFLMALAIAVAVFFIVWGVLEEIGEDPLVWAGISSSLILAFAAVFHEIFRRRNQTKQLLEAEKRNYQDAILDKKGLSLEKNKAIVKSLQKRSQATVDFQSHFEVFNSCNDYLNRTEKELVSIHFTSPRFAALRNGQEKIRPLHKHHLLKWAEMESQRLTREAKFRASMGEKIETAQRALGVIESALEFYPDEPRLTESISVIQEFISSIRIGHFLESADLEIFKGNFHQALDHYQDALFHLQRNGEAQHDRDVLAKEITSKVEKVQEMLQNSKRISSQPPSVR